MKTESLVQQPFSMTFLPKYVASLLRLMTIPSIVYGVKSRPEIAKIIKGILSKTTGVEIRQIFWVEPISC